MARHRVPTVVHCMPFNARHPLPPCTIHHAPATATTQQNPTPGLQHSRLLRHRRAPAQGQGRQHCNGGAIFSSSFFAPLNRPAEGANPWSLFYPFVQMKTDWLNAWITRDHLGLKKEPMFLDHNFLCYSLINCGSLLLKVIFCCPNGDRLTDCLGFKKLPGSKK